MNINEENLTIGDDGITDINGNQEMSNEEKLFNGKVDLYKQSLKFPDKVLITFGMYKNIMFALKHTKGGKSTGIDPKFHFWCKKYFKLSYVAGIEILCSKKDDRRVVTIETYYSVLLDSHLNTGHDGHDKMRFELNQHYCWLPSTVIDIFLECCSSCCVRKSVKKAIVPTAIISVGFLTRLQIDLIDFRSRPDNQYKWILHCQCHYSKFSWEFALESKEAGPVSAYLLELFHSFGPCKILQSDNGREFTATVIKNLRNIWPGLIIINGRPRHPQTQGLMEKVNATLCQILGKLMEDRKTTAWSICLPPTLYSMNTSLARGVQMTPYEIVFGQKPRADYDSWKLIDEQSKQKLFLLQSKKDCMLLLDITMEEDLPPSLRILLSCRLHAHSFFFFFAILRFLCPFFLFFP